MRDTHALTLLGGAKPLAQRLIQTKGLYSLTESDLELLVALKRLIEVDNGEERLVLQAAGLTLYELALLLGTLQLQLKGRRSYLAEFLPFDQTSSYPL